MPALMASLGFCGVRMCFGRDHRLVLALPGVFVFYMGGVDLCRCGFYFSGGEKINTFCCQGRA